MYWNIERVVHHHEKRMVAITARNPTNEVSTLYRDVSGDEFTFCGVCFKMTGELERIADGIVVAFEEALLEMKMFEVVVTETVTRQKRVRVALPPGQHTVEHAETMVVEAPPCLDDVEGLRHLHVVAHEVG